MTHRQLKYIAIISILAAAIVLSVVSCDKTVEIKEYSSASQPAQIEPDYTDITIPPNIAVLNFEILEQASKYQVEFHGTKGQAFAVSSSSGKISIPSSKWKQLLQANKGSNISFDIYVKNPQTGWVKFPTITNIVAAEDIDSHIAFRLMGPICNYWKNIGIYQRNLTNFKTRPILQGSYFGNGCLNCHTFLNNTPKQMTIGIRSADFGSSTILCADGDAGKIDAKWVYTSWHPSGKLAVYSLNKIVQFFHTNRMENRDVLDLDSAIAYYRLDSRQSKLVPPLSEKDLLETYPTWSPDGKFLYYCCAPILWQDRDAVPPENWDKVRYSLKRISYDLDTDTWGQPETVLSAYETGLSILLPRISPDGKFLLFCMCQYSCFPIYQPSSDLYLMDLATGEYKKLDSANSPYSESWHSWSSNGRWIAFSSKRRSGLFTRIYFSYIDPAGNASKPFILPQKDPQYYDSLLKTFSVPELLTQPVTVSQLKLANAVRGSAGQQISMPVTGATSKVESSDPYEQGQR